MPGASKLERENDVSLAVLRQVAQERVDQSSLSQVAREIGISHPTLREFLNGAVPRGLTMAKLRAWYDPAGNEVARLRHEIEALQKRIASWEQARDAAAQGDAPVSLPTDEVLRASLRRAVAASSLRTVAEQVGITHRGLQLYITGESRPRAVTARKFREWYVRDASAYGGADEVTARAAIDVLLAGLPEDGKGRATVGLIDVVRQAFRHAKMDPPDWTTKLVDGDG